MLLSTEDNLQTFKIAIQQGNEKKWFKVKTTCNYKGKKVRKVYIYDDFSQALSHFNSLVQGKRFYYVAIENWLSDNHVSCYGIKGEIDKNLSFFLDTQLPFTTMQNIEYKSIPSHFGF